MDFTRTTISKPSNCLWFILKLSRISRRAAFRRTARRIIRLATITPNLAGFSGLGRARMVKYTDRDRKGCGCAKTAWKSGAVFNLLALENFSFADSNLRLPAFCDLFDVGFLIPHVHPRFDYEPKSHVCVYGKFYWVDMFFSYTRSPIISSSSKLLKGLFYQLIIIK